MIIDYQHNLTQEEAYGRINNLFRDLQKKHPNIISKPQVSWNSEHTEMDYSMEIMKYDIEGKVTLSNGQVSLEAKLPIMVRPFSETIIGMVRKKLDDLLS